MGTSTDATIFYGVTFAEDAGLPWNEEFNDFDDWILFNLGFIKPDNLYEQGRGVIDKYWEDRREFLKNVPVELVYYCSGDYPLYGLAISGTKTTSNRGEAINLDSKLSVPDEEKIKQFTDFLKKFNLEPEDGIGWKLVSYWG